LTPYLSESDDIDNIIEKLDDIIDDCRHNIGENLDDMRESQADITDLRLMDPDTRED
jgi:peptidoglycan hydrolase CwlO-like protein